MIHNIRLQFAFMQHYWNCEGW